MFRVGHDAECFAVDQAGVVQPAIGKVGGSKEEPSRCELGALQEDNVMAELNIHPSESPDEFIRNTNRVMEELKKRLAVYHLDTFIKPSATFTQEALNTPQAMMSGCDPDFDAWGMCENPVIDLAGTTERYAGGHLHFELEYANNPSEVTSFVRRMDAIVGAGMIAVFGISDRFKTYGRFGAHRPKHYGVEYRTIDNSWLLSDSYMKWIWKASHYAAQYMSDNPHCTAKDLNAMVASGDVQGLRQTYNEHCPITLPGEHQWN